MKLRVYVIDQSEAMRRSLEMFIESLGHDVITGALPDRCPYYLSEHNSCHQDHACGDILIFGQNFPITDGIEFIARRIEGGCNGVANNNAIICRPWSDKVRTKAEELGCKFFETPLNFSELQDWIGDIGSRTPIDRKLMPMSQAGLRSV